MHVPNLIRGWETKRTRFFPSIGTPILSPMVYYFIWEPIRKWLEVDSHLGMLIETLGTSLTKFGTSFIKFCTSIPNATGTPILSPMVNYFILEPIKMWLEVDPHLGTHFGTVGTHFVTVGTPFTKFGTSFTKFGTSFIKFGTSFIKFVTSNPITIGILMLSPMVHYFISKPIKKWLEVDPHLETHWLLLKKCYFVACN